MSYKTLFKFSPLFFLYILLVLVFSQNTSHGDESRYLMFATNLLNGYYSPRSDINLWNGPGYPILLIPFLGFHIPLIFAKLLNALFLFLSVIYFYRTLLFFTNNRFGVCFAYLFGLYFPFFSNLYLLNTEIFSVFLICGFMFHFIGYAKGASGKRSNFLASFLYLGYLALTKVFFGWVLVICLFVSLLLSLFRRRFLKLSAPVYTAAIIICIPYLIYTHSLTGKFFYWGNSGGQSLYWMSTLDKEEFGDWFGTEWAITQPGFESHKDFLSKTMKLSALQQDTEFRKQAIKNIKSNPKKYVINWSANVGRMLFSYPYSYTKQKLSTYFYAIPNMFLLIVFLLCLCPAFLCRKLIPFEVYNFLIFGAVTFFGSSLLSAYPRQLFPVVPIILLFVAYTITNILKISLRCKQ
ncbi:MAG: hypothetical protein WC614_07935 [bacterium]